MHARHTRNVQDPVQDPGKIKMILQENIVARFEIKILQESAILLAWNFVFLQDDNSSCKLLGFLANCEQDVNFSYKM